MNEKEKRLLEHLNSVRGILDVPESAFTKIDQSLEKKAKEKRLLENFEKTLEGILHPQPATLTLCVKQLAAGGSTSNVVAAWNFVEQL